MASTEKQIGSGCLLAPQIRRADGEAGQLQFASDIGMVGFALLGQN